jgi:DNA primase
MHTRDGNIGGTVIDLVAILENCSTRDAAIRLRDGFSIPETPPLVPRKSPVAEPVAENPPLGFTLRDIDHTHPYLQQRGISTATAQNFGIGYYPGPGLLHGRVVIPIRNVRHELVAYAGRAIGGEEPKYLLPPGFRKSLMLFNLNRARNAGQRSVVVVEGFFDTVTVHQSGHRNVVGLMGSSLSETQADLLRKHFDRAVLMLDGDDAGRRATELITKRLTPKLGVQIVTLQPDQQPDQLASKEINRLLGGHGRPLGGPER